jgi:hypothetical protein
MIVTRDNARRILESQFPGSRFTIRHGLTIMCRPCGDPRPNIAWRALAVGRDSAVQIGTMRDPQPGEGIESAIDWNAEIA